MRKQSMVELTWIEEFKSKQYAIAADEEYVDTRKPFDKRLTTLGVI